MLRQIQFKISLTRNRGAKNEIKDREEVFKNPQRTLKNALSNCFNKSPLSTLKIPKPNKNHHKIMNEREEISTRINRIHKLHKKIFKDTI